MMYKFTDATEKIVMIIEDDGKSYISFPVYRDGVHQDEYKEWLSEGNVTLPANSGVE